MARPEHPSDVARRKIKPHVRVHHSLPNHPRTAPVWAENDLLATWLRVMLKASRQGAAHTGDILHLTDHEIEETSGKGRRDVARRLLSRLADVAGWSVERRANVTAIHVRNFAKKQNIAPRVNGVTTPLADCSPPPVPTPNPPSPLRGKNEAGFDEAWKLYPRRAGGNSKKAALRAWRARLAAGVKPETITDGVKRYAAFVRSKKKEGTEFVKQASGFFGPDEHYLEPWVNPQAWRSDPTDRRSFL